MIDSEMNSPSERIDVTLPGELSARVRADAEADDRTLSEMVRRIVRMYYRQLAVIAQYERLFAKLNESRAGELPRVVPRYSDTPVPRQGAGD